MSVLVVSSGASLGHDTAMVVWAQAACRAVSDAPASGEQVVYVTGYTENAIERTRHAPYLVESLPPFDLSCCWFFGYDIAPRGCAALLWLKTDKALVF